jgi:protein TonB
MAGMLLTAAAFYVWAPGSSYFERVTTMSKSLFARKPTDEAIVEAKPSASSEKSTSIDAAPKTATEPEAAIPSSNTEDTSNIQVNPVTEPSDMNTGAPRPFRPTGPVGIKLPDENLAVPLDSSANQATAKQPTSEQAAESGTSARGAPVSVPSPIAPATAASGAAVSPSVIAAVDHPATELPQSLRISTPINPVQAAVPATPAMAAGNALTTTVLPEETARELLVKKVQPVYPEQAMHSGIQGAVVLQAWIAKDGSVRDLKLLRGSFVLARAAVDAVRQWQFKPYVSNGQATEVQTTITVGFKLPTTVVNMGAPSDSPKP